MVSCYRRFKFRAQHVLGSVHRLSAVTTPRGCDVATPAHSVRTRVLPHVVGCYCHVLAATGPATWSCCRCSHGRAAWPPASPRCRSVDPPRAATQPLPLSSHHHRVCTNPLCLYPAAGLIRCRAHMAKLIVALQLMGLRPRGHAGYGRTCLSVASACASHQSRRPRPTKARPS